MFVFFQFLSLTNSSYSGFKWMENQIRQNPQITTEELAKMSKKGITTFKLH